MTDLITFLKARLGEDEQWALAASTPYKYAAGDPAVPATGVHWHWVTGDDWEPTQVDPATSEFVAEPGTSCNLASVETWPTNLGQRDMPRVVADDIIEMDSAAAGHIARHDPAWVLREVEAKRQIIAALERDEARLAAAADQSGTAEAHVLLGQVFALRDVARALALPYADHKDYREEWRP